MLSIGGAHTAESKTYPPRKAPTGLRAGRAAAASRRGAEVWKARVVRSAGVQARAPVASNLELIVELVEMEGVLGLNWLPSSW